MPSKREAANSSNAGKSTGPRTPSGKLASSRNALSHGLTAVAALLPSEDPDEFAALELAIASNYIDSPFVKPMVLQLASVMWRLARFRRIESLALLSRISGRMSQGVTDPEFERPLEFQDFPEAQGYASTVESGIRMDVEMLGENLVRLSRYENSLLNQLTRLMAMLEPYATGCIQGAQRTLRAAPEPSPSTGTPSPPRLAGEAPAA